MATRHTPLFTTAMTVLTELRSPPFGDRISSDEAGVLAAMAVALRADCTRRWVAAVVVDLHGRIIGTGRNGAASGQPGCLSARACPRGRLSRDEIAPGSSYSTDGAGACIALHAEDNALLYTDPMARRGGTIFITDAPCDDCARRIAGSGLARVVWPEHGTDGWHLVQRLVGVDPLGGNYR